MQCTPRKKARFTPIKKSENPQSQHFQKIILTHNQHHFIQSKTQKAQTQPEKTQTKHFPYGKKTRKRIAVSQTTSHTPHTAKTEKKSRKTSSRTRSDEQVSQRPSPLRSYCYTNCIIRCKRSFFAFRASFSSRAVLAPVSCLFYPASVSGHGSGRLPSRGCPFFLTWPLR